MQTFAKRARESGVSCCGGVKQTRQIMRISHPMASRRMASKVPLRSARVVTAHDVDLAHNLQIDAAELPEEKVIFESSDAMQQVRQGMELALREDLPLLLLGESGTGKQLIAKYLHLRSKHAYRPFQGSIAAL